MIQVRVVVASIAACLGAMLLLTAAPPGRAASQLARRADSPGRPNQRPNAEVAKSDSLRVLLIHDMEGVSGIDDQRMLGNAFPELFAKGRQSLIADINAVVAGLFDGGATAVDIKNSHGGCDDLSCVPRDQLDRRAAIIVADGRLDPYSQMAVRSAWDVVVAVGMHDKPLSGGFAPHTMSPGLSPIINGHTLTETELIGYSFGSVGIPVIFVSGDDHLKRDLANSMPWIEYVVVKQATGANSATLLPPDKVHAQLRAAAKRAIQARNRMRSMELTTPFEAGLLPTFPVVLPQRLPGVKYRGDTVTFVAHDYLEAYGAIKALQSAAGSRFGRCPVCPYLARLPGFDAAQRQAYDSIDAQTNAFEDGRMKVAPRPAIVQIGKYHRVP